MASEFTFMYLCTKYTVTVPTNARQTTQADTDDNTRHSQHTDRKIHTSDTSLDE